MADDAKKEEAAATDAGAAPPKSKKNLVSLILVILNLLGILGVFGVFYYTEYIFKRPAITEESEREFLEKSLAQAPQSAEGKVGYLLLDQIQANLMPDPGKPETVQRSDQQMTGIINRLTLTINLQIGDVEKKPKVEEVKAVLYDRILSLLGNKNFQELNTIQGRYLLRSQILGIANDLAKERVVTDVFFNEFVLQ